MKNMPALIKILTFLNVLYNKKLFTTHSVPTLTVAQQLLCWKRH